MDVTPKTKEEHVMTMVALVRLQLGHLHRWLSEHEGEAFADALRKRTDLWRWTKAEGEGPDDHAAWQALAGQAEAEWQRSAAAGADRFEAAAIEVFRTPLEAWWRRDWDQGFPSHMFQAGSLRYDAPRPDSPDRIFFHIGNAVQPHSIFDDPHYLPRCFAELISRARAEHGVAILATATWLNSYHRWLRLFPPDWQANMEPAMTDVGAGMGWWGQFLNGRGTLNEKHARLLRETGRMPFLPRKSWCTFAALERHLDNIVRSIR